VIVRAAGLRVAGYSDPFERFKRDNFKGTQNPRPTPAQQKAFEDWLLPIVPKIDAVMVHEPALAETAVRFLRAHPPNHPIVFFEGHTHVESVQTFKNVAVLNGGSIGAGGPANANEHTPLALAVLTFQRGPFRPIAVDTVSIDPGTGSAKAQRQRLDESVSFTSSRPG
jgi:Calcineurin-like phosphoesterase superfamily domain